MLVYGTQFRVYPHDILPRTSITIAGIDIPVMRLIILAISLFMMATLYFFIQKTKTGTAIRAAAIDQGAARLMGINVDRVIAIVFMTRPCTRWCRWSHGRAVLRPDQLHNGLGLG